MHLVVSTALALALALVLALALALALDRLAVQQAVRLQESA